jgi:hypothetical protein
VSAVVFLGRLARHLVLLVCVSCAVLAGTSLRAATPFPGDEPGVPIGENLTVDCPDHRGKFESSGLVWQSRATGESLFVVSDSGKLARMDAAGIVTGCWTIAGDLEALSLIDPLSPEIYIGVEYDESPTVLSPRILEFDADAGAVTREFDLTELATFITIPDDPLESPQGLEALTFVPDPGHTEGGLFYAGLQEDGRIYVFELPIVSGGESATLVNILTPMPGLAGIRALHYHRTNDVLYAIFDDGITVLLLAMSADGSLIASWDLPGREQEGVAVQGCDLFVAEDDVGGDESGRVWWFAGFPAGPEDDGDADEDGVTDCSDLCPGTPADTPVNRSGCECPHGPAVCGNGVCEADAENCVVCSEDCNGKQSGSQASRYCCGNQGGYNPVGCSDPRCSEGGFTCSVIPTSCCGDGDCGPNETPCSCAADCPPPEEDESPGLTCDDGADNDCDALADCIDPDCRSPELDCGDGLDNDCDGAVDCDDCDCCAACGCPDADGDLVACDCDDGNALVWAIPGEVHLWWETATLLDWTAPADPGGTGQAVLEYDVLRSPKADNFLAEAVCLESSGTAVTDDLDPPAGFSFHYLVRANNACGDGRLGARPTAAPRSGRACP